MKPRRMMAFLAAMAVTLALSPMAQAAPVVFWASDPIEPGETALIEGANLNSVSTVTFARLADDRDAAAGPAAGGRAGKILQNSGHSVKVIVPPGLEPGVLAYELVTPQGKIGGILNAPTVYWAQGDHGALASPGGWIRVMGRNITRAPGAVLLLSSLDGRTHMKLAPQEAGLWDARFDLPATTAPGTYSLKLWNGRGDQQAVADAGTLKIAPPLALPGTRIDVRQLGARGNGSTDDTVAFKAALLQLARAGGGTLSIPRGTYLISEKLTVPPNVGLRGEDETLSVLILKDADTPPDVFIEGTSAFRLENFTILTTRHNHIISGGFLPDGNVVPDASIAIDHLTIRANMYRKHLKSAEITALFDHAMQLSSGGPDTIRLGGGNNAITDCDIYGSGRAIFLLAPTKGLVRGNRIMNGRFGWYNFSKPNGLIFENNDIIGADLQSTGGGINTLSGSQRAIAQNVLVKNNRFSLLHGGDGEAMTSDDPGGCYNGPVEIAAMGATATLPGQTAAEAAHLAACPTAGGLIILNGTGMGEHALITGIENGTVHLDRSMPIATDGTSRALVIPVQQHYLVIGNTATDVSVAFQFYGSSWEQIAADNTAVRSGGLVVQAQSYGGNLQPALYTQFLGNTLMAGNISSVDTFGPVEDALLRVRALPVPQNTDPLVYGAVMRGNHLNGNAHIDIRAGKVSDPAITDVIIENNAIKEADVGITVDNGTEGVLIQNNTFDRVPRPVQEPSPK